MLAELHVTSTGSRQMQALSMYLTQCHRSPWLSKLCKISSAVCENCSIPSASIIAFVTVCRSLVQKEKEKKREGEEKRREKWNLYVIIVIVFCFVHLSWLELNKISKQMINIP